MPQAMPCKPEEIEWIVWEDAVGESSRDHEQSLREKALAVNSNIGWVIHETEKLIVLAHGRSTTGEVDHLTIPVSCILERHKPLKSRRRG